MLAIRMQRQGRKGHASFRVVVQDSRTSPSSGKVVARLGSYDPHTKNLTLVKDRAEHFLTHGAQPSPRVAMLLKQEGIKLPEWVKLAEKKESNIKKPEKLRKNRPAEEVVETTVDAPAVEAETPEATPSAEAPAPATEVEVAAEAAPVEEAPEAETEEPKA
jgi:small subunit ribosomal protein S16